MFSLRSILSWVVSNSVLSPLIVEFPWIPWISLNSWKFKEFSVWSTHIGLLCVSLRSTLSWVVSNSVSSSLIVEFLEFHSNCYWISNFWMVGTAEYIHFIDLWEQFFESQNTLSYTLEFALRCDINVYFESWNKYLCLKFCITWTSRYMNNYVYSL